MDIKQTIRDFSQYIEANFTHFDFFAMGFVFGPISIMFALILFS